MSYFSSIVQLSTYNVNLFLIFLAVGGRPSAVKKRAPLVERDQGRSGDAVCGFCLPHSGHRRVQDVNVMRNA